jgi:hypothetical protein
VLRIITVLPVAAEVAVVATHPTFLGADLVLAEVLVSLAEEAPELTAMDMAMVGI